MKNQRVCLADFEDLIFRQNYTVATVRLNYFYIIWPSFRAHLTLFWMRFRFYTQGAGPEVPLAEVENPGKANEGLNKQDCLRHASLKLLQNYALNECFERRVFYIQLHISCANVGSLGITWRGREVVS